MEGDDNGHEWRSTVIISIHALRVEGDKKDIDTIKELSISIHALRVEGDQAQEERYPFLFRFLSTPSGWRATVSASGLLPFSQNFYPRPPGGGRRPDFPGYVRFAIFLSTPSGWRATYGLHERAKMEMEFLSTPSGWRATYRKRRRCNDYDRFLSTPSGWRATMIP